MGGLRRRSFEAMEGFCLDGGVPGSGGVKLRGVEQAKFGGWEACLSDDVLTAQPVQEPGWESEGQRMLS